MLLKIKDKFDLFDYQKLIKISEKNVKLSYFFKEINSIKDHSFLFLNIKTSKTKIIYEIGGFIFKNGKICEQLFNEYRLPSYELVRDKYTNLYVKSTINQNRPLFNSQDYAWLMGVLNEVDYIVCYDHTELYESLFRFKKTQQELFNIKAFNTFNIGKVICLKNSIVNKYFQKIGISKSSNNEILKLLSWNIDYNNERVICLNKELSVNLNLKIASNLYIKETENTYVESIKSFIIFLTLGYINNGKFG